jgi:hypothetical protein
VSHAAAALYQQNGREKERGMTGERASWRAKEVIDAVFASITLC